MYGSVKWCIVSGVAFVDRRTCAWPYTAISHKSPTTSTQFTRSCELRRGSDRSTRARAHTRTLTAHEEKFLSANFIEDDRMITALREFLINRGNFYRNR